VDRGDSGGSAAGGVAQPLKAAVIATAKATNFQPAHRIGEPSESVLSLESVEPAGLVQ
jgi:hypothetical protein